MIQKRESANIIMMGATGAVGTAVVKALVKQGKMTQLTLLGRTPLEAVKAPIIVQQKIDVTDPTSYQRYLHGHEVAICTLGVGQPSKVSKEQFLKIDKEAVLAFAKACKAAGVQHFSLLASVDINAKSYSFYLRSKGELVDAIQALEFDRFSVFQPSMILTPGNRYGIVQGVTLKVWPLLNPVLRGKFKKYRGVKVKQLGKAMAYQVFTKQTGSVERLKWSDFQELTKKE